MPARKSYQLNIPGGFLHRRNIHIPCTLVDMLDLPFCCSAFVTMVGALLTLLGHTDLHASATSTAKHFSPHTPLDSLLCLGAHP